MAYRFRRKESVQAGLRRIVREQIATAADYLDPPNAEGPEAEAAAPPAGHDPHEAVHEARKCFKKIRAALRLVRPSLKAVYSEENAWFRDVARRLSRLRDAEALLETIDALREAFAGEMGDALWPPIQEALTARRRRIAKEEVDLDERVAAVAAELREARGRVAALSLSDKEFDALAGGLRKTYARGRDAMVTAAEDPAAENFHEWRKRAKYHRYHMDMMQNVWPKELDARRKSMHDLTDYLGDNHDLDVLRQTLLAEPDLAPVERDRQTLLGLIGRRQEDLQAGAHALGRRLYAEKPKAFVGRLASYWDAWKAGR